MVLLPFYRVPSLSLCTHAQRSNLCKGVCNGTLTYESGSAYAARRQQCYTHHFLGFASSLYLLNFTRHSRTSLQCWHSPLWSFPLIFYKETLESLYSLNYIWKANLTNVQRFNFGLRNYFQRCFIGLLVIGHNPRSSSDVPKCLQFTYHCCWSHVFDQHSRISLKPLCRFQVWEGVCATWGLLCGEENLPHVQH